MAATTQKTLSVYEMAQAKNYLDWVMPALLRHKAGKAFLEEFDFEIEGINILEDTSCWDIIKIKEEMLQIQPIEEKQKPQQKTYFENWDSNKDYSGKRERVFSQLNWQYQNKTATKLQGNISISEIKRKWQETEDFLQEEQWSTNLEMPQFEKEEKKLTAVEIGTATHTFMEQIDITKKYSYEEIVKIAMDLVQKNILSKKEAKALSYKEIVAFFHSSIAQRIAKASYVEKEKGFSMLVKANEILKQKEYEDVEDNIVINGIIDCFFEEDGELVLLDYKNDRIWGEKNEDTLKKRYEIQMYFYKKALEKTTGKRVKEVYLYSFALKKEIAMI